MSSLDFIHDQLPGRIVFGAGRRRDIGHELERSGAERVLIVGGSHETVTIQELVEELDVRSDTIIGVRPHVPASAVSGALEIVDRFTPDVVVSVGGGSATGMAKMIALHRDVQLIAVPTTYAGSEMTPIWGTTDDGVKQTGRSLRVLPSVVIYDPELTLGLPATVSVNSAFNALAHVVEALWLPETSPITVEIATVAIGAIVDAVSDVVARPVDLDARARLMYGAHRAGSVLAVAGTGLLHQTAHVLGGMFDLDHGAMYAVLTPHMVAHHVGTDSTIDRRLTVTLGADPAATLGQLAGRLGAPRTLAELGFPTDQFRSAVQAVSLRAHVRFADVEPVLHAAVFGAPNLKFPNSEEPK